MPLSDHLSIAVPLEDKKHAGERANLDRVGEGIDSGSSDAAVGVRIGFTDALNKLLE
jgi:hypothetical protein